MNTIAPTATSYRDGYTAGINTVSKLRDAGEIFETRDQAEKRLFELGHPVAPMQDGAEGYDGWIDGWYDGALAELGPLPAAADHATCNCSNPYCQA